MNFGCNEIVRAGPGVTPGYESQNMDTESSGENQRAEDSSAEGARITAGLTEDAALALLKSPDATADALAQLAKNLITSKSRKVLVALIAHSRTPRHVSIPLLRTLFTFDLMNLALTAAVAPDVNRAAEQQILTGYAWVDQAHGVVRIPIERAMDLLAQRGVATRPQTDQQNVSRDVSMPTESGLGPKMQRPGGPLAGEMK